MEVDSYPNGVPSWIDLGTSDLPKARAFYGDLFGWDIQEGPPEAGGYSIAHLRGKPVAGLGPQQNPGPPYWTVYINVDSADAIVTTMADNGGQVFMPPFDVMDVGRMAIGADPTGAVFGLWEPRQHKGAGIVNEPNTFSWAELVTDDVDAAKSFYTSVFGWTAETYGEGVGRLHRGQARRSVGGRHHGEAADVPDRSAQQLGRVLLGHRHRQGGRTDQRARRLGLRSTDGHRARTFRGRQRSGRCVLPRDHAEGDARLR